MSRCLPLLLLTMGLCLPGCRSPAPTLQARSPLRAPTRVAPSFPRVVPAVRSPFTEKNVPLEQVLARARSSGRPALLYFCDERCGFCDKMNRQTLSRPEVYERVTSSFVAVEYDAGTEPGRSLGHRYGARGFPALVVVGADGVATNTIIGFRDADALLSALGAP